MRRNGICRGLVALLLAAGCRDAPIAPGAPGAAGGIDSAPVRIDLSTVWVRANPSEVGMSPIGLQSATNAAAAIPRFRSLLVARHGRLVAESYFGGADSTTLFDVPFPHAGAYRFEITIDAERKAAVPLTVSQLPAQPPGGPAGQTLH